MSTPIPSDKLTELESVARAAAGRAYAPYSKFRVGAAVLGDSGKIHSGCNVENASYGLASCAERNAIFAAVGAGERAIRAVVIYTPTPTATAPCGACRQVIREFGPDAVVISVCDGADRLESTLAELLPRSFGPEDLG
jgi:cytidine deaminase